MRFAFASHFTYGLSLWERVRNEGNEVKVWVSPEAYCKSVGDGIIAKSGTWDELKAWSKEAPSVVVFDSSGMGIQADEARRAGMLVLGGCSFGDRIEKDRAFGFKIAEAAGMQLPPYEEFSSFSEALSYCKGIKHGIYFKPDRYLDSDATHGADNGELMAEYLEDLIHRYGGHGKCILQESIDGVALSTARWWNGTSFVGLYEGAYENKKLMNDNVGPSTGCSFNAVWHYDDEQPEMARLLNWEALEPIFRKNEASPGIYDANCMVDDDGNAWFLEWCGRMGYDSETTGARLIPDYGAHLYAIAAGKEPPEVSNDFAYSIRAGVPPYPWEHGKQQQKGSPDGVAVHGTNDERFVPYLLRKDGDMLVMAGSEGIVGLSCTTGDTLSEMHDEALEYLKEGLRVPGLEFRTDGGEDCREAAERLLKAGIDVPNGLLV
jgi:phosphoribosylamine---glycine ligase